YLVGEWLRKNDCETVYVHRSHGHELVVSSQLSSWQDAISVKRSYVRRFASKTLAFRLGQQARLALRYADGTVVPSTVDKKFVIQHESASPESVRAIFHASVPAYLESDAEPYTEERHRRLLYVGNFTRVKGGDILWHAGTALLRKFPDLTLTIVADRNDHS